MAADTAPPPPIPTELAVLRLPYPLILHPGLVLSVTLPQKQCFGLLRTALAEKGVAPNSTPLDAAGTQEDSSVRSLQKQSMFIACMPAAESHASRKVSGSDAPAVSTFSLDGWSSWGCAARVLRLVHMPTTNECSVVLSGIARVYAEHVRAPRISGIPSPTPVASSRVFMDPDQLPAAQDASTSLLHMKGAAEKLMTLMVPPSPLPPPPDAPVTNSALASVPLMPPSLLQNVTIMLNNTKSQITASIMSDLLVGMLGGACEWTARVAHLATPDVQARIDLTIAMFEDAVHRMQTVREVLTNTPFALQDQNRGALVRAQIEALVKQVASLTSTGVALRVIDQGRESRKIMLPPSKRQQGPRVIRRVIGNDNEDPSHAPDDASDEGTEGDEFKELSTRLAQRTLPSEPRRACEQELRRLKRMPEQSMERSVLINYLETMLDLPWDRVSEDLTADELKTLVPHSLAEVPKDASLMQRARLVLEEDHYGLEKIKRRMIEYLAVLELKSEQVPKGQKAANHGPILLLVGPPGTGKTSIARSLAAALQRPFVRVSLGGVRDEAEIRGHRRTYVGALPGSIVSSLRKARTSDCVMLLDELDKLSSGMRVHGDPTAAMLEVLDPEQNHTFKDHYLNVPIDLSRVIFIATANSLDTIPEPLLDRVDIVPVAGYTYDEKVAIAMRHLLPKQIRANGLQPDQVNMSRDVLLLIAHSYTREAGVRTMERRIGDVVRAKAVEYASAKDRSTYSPKVTKEDVERILGAPAYEPEVADELGVPGVATGMAYQGSGMGGILHIECAFLPPGQAALKLTGSLGDVIRESAELAFAWVKAHAFALGISAGRDVEFPKNDVHLHMPSGATPKDGPSAGVAFVCALVSMYLRVPLDTRLAMTGELTLRGHITPVGGIKEKVLGAHRAGIRRVILPQRNAREYDDDIPQAVKADMTVVYVRTIQDALQAVFGASLETQINTLYGGIEGRRRLQELEWHSRL